MDRAIVDAGEAVSWFQPGARRLLFDIYQVVTRQIDVERLPDELAPLAKLTDALADVEHAVSGGDQEEESEKPPQQVRLASTGATRPEGIVAHSTVVNASAFQRARPGRTSELA